MPRLQTQLLPFERQLIAELGCSEEEYFNFKQQVYWLSRERPAAYDGIPDINNVGVVAIVLAVVGILFQAAAYFLTPKPDIQQERRQISNRSLDSIAGRDRFAPTYNFQVAQELTRYGETIPIVFTQQKRVQLTVNGRADWYYVGGIMVAPKLVWSRMFSWGGYQSLSMVFLVGQSPIPRGPYTTASDIAADRAGIYIGQLPLDSFADSDYRWYYYQGAAPSSNGTDYQPTSGSLRTTSDSRLKGHNNRHGSFSTPEAADANAFAAQSFAGLTGEAFCHVFSPSNRIQFGAYNGLPNGTGYRLNFEVVSYPGSAAAGQLQTAIAKRIQITGNPLLAGTGRNYARQFGIVEHNGVEYPAPNQNNGTKVIVNVNDTITIIYNAGKVQETLVYNANHPNLSGAVAPRYYLPDTTSLDNKQIISAIQTEHEQQDELLKFGTKWMIGNCMWEVVERTPVDTVFDKTDPTPYSVKLKCIAVYGDGGPGYVGVCHRPYITSSTHLPETDQGALYDIGQAWFPICKAELATFQNTRRCQVTEIGIKSNVWARLNSICNFNSVPTPDKLFEFDSKNVSLTGGVNQSYVRRSSFFHLYVRPANNDYGPEEGWVKLNPYPFCITGSAPQDQYNAIRIAQPNDQFEYRLRPITSGEIVQIIDKNKEVNFGGITVKGPCIRLNSDGVNVPNPKQFYRESNISTSYGTFTLYARGFIDSIADLATHGEMARDPVYKNQGGVSSTIFGSIGTVKFLGAWHYSINAPADLRRISNGISKAINKDPDPATEGTFVDVPYFPMPVNGEYLFNEQDRSRFFYDAPDGRDIKLTLRLRVENLGTTSVGRSLFWTIVNSESIPAEFINSSQNQRQVGEKFTITAQLFDGSRIDYYFEINAPNQVRLPAGVSSSLFFEGNSAIAEVSHYNTLISRSCDSGPEHEITYINENIANDAVQNGIASYTGCAMAGIKMRSNFNLNSFEQLHIYQKNGMQVTNLRRASNGSISTTFGPSSIFTDLAYYLLTNKQTGAGELISPDLIDVEQFARTGSFLEANHLYYDDVIVNPQNLREFLARISSSLLCNLVMRSGRFSIEPALPIDVNQNYTFYDVKVPISGIFTEGNIIEDSFQLEYISAQERLPIRAAVRYRTELPNRFAQEQTTVVYYADQSSGSLEEFNFTHITSRYHAELLAKYILSSRRHRTHLVSFKTLPYGLALAPGDFIRVVTEAGHVSAGSSGIIKADGVILTPASLSNGQSLNVYIWNKTDAQVSEDTITVQQRGELFYANKSFNSFFSIKNTTTQSLVYMVDSIDLDEEGLIQVTGSHFPIDENGYSVIANELKSSYNGFITTADLSPD